VRSVLGFGGRLYRKLLAQPFVYDRVRPWVIGGLDMSPVYESLEAGPNDVIVDVGCGTGDALRYLPSFSRYHGFDVDAAAIEVARERAAGRRGVTYEPHELTATDLASLQPSLVILAGLLHHLDDSQAVELLELLAQTPSIRRIVTQDVVYLPDERVSNLLARLDRGKHVRGEQGYRNLVARAGLELETARIVRSRPHSGRALYLVLTLALPLQ
jgi:SAM-dependent methyltransferase